MNKTELVAAMAEKTGTSKKDAEKALNAFMETVEDVMKSGDKLQLVGFGTFETVSKAARVGNNPRTKTKVEIPASIKPKFKPGAALKEAAAMAKPKKK